MPTVGYQTEPRQFVNLADLQMAKQQQNRAKQQQAVTNFLAIAQAIQQAQQNQQALAQDKQKQAFEQQKFNEQNRQFGVTSGIDALKAQQDLAKLAFTMQQDKTGNQINLAKEGLFQSNVPTERLNLYQQKAQEYGQPFPYQQIGGEFYKQKTGFGKTQNIADPTGLNSEQQLQARQLGRKIAGVRGTENILPSIYEQMRQGKTIDEIEDNLRYAGQSKEFVGPVRNAAQTIMLKSPGDISQKAMDYIDDELSKGNSEAVKSQLKRLSILQADAGDRTSVISKERTIKMLDEIQGDLNKLEQKGIDTNIFSGTAEEVARKVGTVINPEARKLATKIQTMVQNYRRGMTGVQFGMIENKEYKEMFPSIKKTGKLNTSIIEGLKESFTGDLDNFYSLSMGEDNYKKVFGGMKGSKGSTETNKYKSKYGLE